MESRAPALDDASRSGRILLAAGLAVLAGATVLAAADVGPFWVWYYHCAWAGTLAAMAGGLAVRTGRWPLGRGALLSLFFWSAPVWYVFELLNLRLENWYYVSVPADPGVRWSGTFLAFTTVLPALHLAHGWARELGLARGIRGGGFRVRSVHLAAVGLGGVSFLVLALVWREIFYPLVWGALTLLLEPWNYRRDPDASLLGDLARGRWGRLLRLLAGGLVIGLLWETYNALAAGRWIYTVPGLEGMKVFEMPVPGFLGFPVLALDGFVAYRALSGIGVAVPAWCHDDPDGRGDAAGPGAGGGEGAGGLRPGRAVPAVAAALLFCGTVQAEVDRRTVEAVHPELEDLPAVTPDDAARLRAAGVERVAELAGADSAALAGETGLPPARAGAAVRAAALADLRGMGASNTAALWSAGVRSVCGLAAADEGWVSRTIRAARSAPLAGKPARIRVWLRAARERCPAGPGGGRRADRSGPGRGPHENSQ